MIFRRRRQRDEVTNLIPGRARVQSAKHGLRVLLQLLSDGSEAEQIIKVIGDQYEVVRNGDVVEVIVDDVRFPDEAVVRLALLLDDIEPDWQSVISWPRTKS